jgi:hypothetical protein
MSKKDLEEGEKPMTDGRLYERKKEQGMKVVRSAER